MGMRARLLQQCVAACVTPCGRCWCAGMRMRRSNARGDLMLSALNLTSHLHHEGVQYRLPGAVSNDALVGAAPSAAAELSVARGSSSSSSCDGASSNGTGGQ